MSLPRGIRNNNPGNVERKGDWRKWQGLHPEQTDDRFLVMVGPEWGIRMIKRILLNYKKLYGLATVKGLINRWAPPVENDTAAYYRVVAKKLGVSPDEEIDLQDLETMKGLVKAIIQHENGPGDWYDDEIIEMGLSLP